MDTITLKLTLRLDSDFHTGTGYGIKGQADAMQMTERLADGKERPIIPRREFRGRLRDRLEYLCELMKLDKCDGEYREGNGSTEDDKAMHMCGVDVHLDVEPCPICRIFGSPGMPRGFDFSDLQVCGEQDLADQHHVSIDPDTGRAAGDHFFIFQVARTDELTATITETFAHEHGYALATREQDALLLIGALRLLRRIGGKTRRGLGRCVVDNISGLPPQCTSISDAIGRLKTEVLQKCTASS